MSDNGVTTFTNVTIIINEKDPKKAYITLRDLLNNPIVSTFNSDMYYTSDEMIESDTCELFPKNH